MAIQILSDLHLEAFKEYDSFEITPTAPFLALLGDIGNLAKHTEEFLNFLSRQLQQFQIVFFVPGNHEAYHTSWPEALKALRQFETEVSKNAPSGKFVLLDRSSYPIPGTNTVVLGCSLFSLVPDLETQTAVSGRVQDFARTIDWNVAQHNAAHRRDLAWLNEQVASLENSDTDIIILTHWAPSTDPLSTDARHIGSAINCAFSTDLSEQACFKSGRVRVWAFGHTHYNCDFEVQRKGSAGRIRLVTNQRGYSFAQAAGFDMGKKISLA